VRFRELALAPGTVPFTSELARSLRRIGFCGARFTIESGCSEEQWLLEGCNGDAFANFAATDSGSTNTSGAAVGSHVGAAKRMRDLSDCLSRASQPGADEGWPEVYGINPYRLSADPTEFAKGLA
jgi:hypothetical protein